MKLATSSLILWLSLGGGLAQSDTSPDAEESYSNWGLRHIRGSFESVNSYFDSFLELLGGKNGVCQYRCRYGECTVSPPVDSCRWTCEQLRRVTAGHELFLLSSSSWVGLPDSASENIRHPVTFESQINNK